MLTIKEQSNYLARVVKLENPKKHPSADRLQIWNVNGYDIITDMSRKEGDICIYFPLECQINSDILSSLDLFSDKELNSNKEVAGYVHRSGRVRAVKLRGVLSEGMVLPLEEVLYHLAGVKDGPLYNSKFWTTNEIVGQDFDTIDGITICKKYVPVVSEPRSKGDGIHKQKGLKAKDFLLPGQFNFHYNTSKLQDNLWKFENEEDIIVITDKWHGCVSGDTIVETLEYGNKVISEIVNNKIDCHIKAFDIQTQEVVYVPIDEYYLKPNHGDWLEIELEDGRKIQITDNNPVWLPQLSCYREAGKLAVGDTLLID